MKTINEPKQILTNEKSEKGEAESNTILFEGIPPEFSSTSVAEPSKLAITLNWDQKIIEMEQFFETTELPS